ncbi:MAG TPA: hypothetical protein VND96_01705 [Candidatus Micrarchaeaceae archaeon]|nr:hypothetical protein [Candidatus Micrarchaeaceae archaeon]
MIALIGIDGLLIDPSVGGTSFGAALAAVSGAYAYILWRTSNVVLYSHGALVGTGVRPRWIESGQIRGISAEMDRNLWGRAGHAPVIQLTSGGHVKLGFFFAADGSNRDIALDVVNGLNATRPVGMNG